MSDESRVIVTIATVSIYQFAVTHLGFILSGTPDLTEADL